MKHCFKALVLAATVTIGSFTQVAVAEVTVGVSLSATGPAAALGIPGRNTLALLPDTIAGEKVRYIFLDDATDS
ncbi:MAG TPA: branched-chain amino acid ABC transporter substrate-binding protein, partial [Burkholderiaceae bacterium]|nr:branched-chain amino acid ABC transporter substrate-binding protein [Burkholderiaceae bacterium]